MRAGAHPLAWAFVAAPLTWAAGQLALGRLRPAGSLFDTLAANAALWRDSHLLMAAALVGYALMLCALWQLGARAAPAVATLGALLAAVGLLGAAFTTALDLAFGVLARLPERAAALELHARLSAALLPAFDLLDSGLVLGFALLAVALYASRRVPQWAAALALLGLAVPSFAGLQLAAAAAQLVGFGALGLALHLARKRGFRYVGGRVAAGLVCCAFLPAAFWSWPRLLLFVLVLGGMAWLERPARESNVFGRGRETSEA